MNWNLKTYQSLRICLIKKFSEKIEMSKFGLKNTLFGYF